MSAAATGNLDVLKMLLAARCDAESADTWMGFTPLFFATMGRKVDALDILLRARCDPHKTLDFGVPYFKYFFGTWCLKGITMT